MVSRGAKTQLWGVFAAFAPLFSGVARSASMRRLRFYRSVALFRPGPPRARLFASKKSVTSAFSVPRNIFSDPDFPLPSFRPPLAV